MTSLVYILSVYAIVHIFKEKRVLSIYDGCLTLLSKLPVSRVTDVFIELLTCSLCMNFWVGGIGHYILTYNIFESIIFGLACYSFTAILDKWQD